MDLNTVWCSQSLDKLQVGVMVPLAVSGMGITFHIRNLSSSQWVIYLESLSGTLNVEVIIMLH